MIPEGLPEPGGNSQRPVGTAYRVPVVVALLLISVFTNVILLQRATAPIEVTSISGMYTAGYAFADLAEGPEPLLIALGDFFFFSDSSRYPERTHFIRDIEVNSPEDLRRFSVTPAGPTAPYGPSVRPSSMTYLPKATAFALEAILPLAHGTGKPVSIKLMSDVTSEDLHRNDIIYIGFVRSMGALQDYFFQLSSFASNPPFLELNHKESGEKFGWSGDVYGQMQDYGLFSKIPGPGQGEIVIFTGLHDIGILHAVRALTDPGRGAALELSTVANNEAASSAVEILFKVSGYNRTDLEATAAAVSLLEGAQIDSR